MKPCPFCGSADIKTNISYEGDTVWGAWAYCEKCGVRGPELYFRNVSKSDMHAAALGAWDVRAEVKP